MKKCYTCHISKPLEMFADRPSSKDGKKGICGECEKKYNNNYYKNKNEQYKARRRNVDKQRKLQVYAVINEYLITKGCIDCGYDKSPAALQFDHIKGKKIDSISSMINRQFSLPKIMEEINKCEIRCANCHHIKTAKDFNWYQ